MYEYITKGEVREYRGPKMENLAKSTRECHEDWLMNLSDAEYDEYMRMLYKTRRRA